MRNVSMVLVGLLCVAAFSAHAAKLYKWVDKDGNVSYQDSPPPAGQGRVEEKNIKQPQLAVTPDLKAIAAKSPVVVYVANKCAACEIARSYLTKRNIPFVEKSVEGDIATQKELMQLSGGAMRVPTIKVGTRTMTEYSQGWLESELDAAGYPKAGAPAKDAAATQKTSGKK